MGHLVSRTFKLVGLPFTIVAMVVAGEAMGALVSLAPTKDNTLYEKSDGSLSNGAGEFFFAGRNDKGEDEDVRRTVMAFDVAGNVPAGSVIQSATLTLQLSKTHGSVGAMTFDLHRLTSDWGEGASDAGDPGGAGTSADPNDATWLHTFWDSSDPDFWSTPGGDFDPNVSGSATVNKTGPYSWLSTTRMVSDVQSWLDTPTANFGWMLRGPEDVRSAKRFNSRENSIASTRPTLVIDFASAGPVPFNWIGTGSGGLFQDDANWDTGVAPSSPTDIVNLINTELTDQVVTLSDDITIDDLTIDGDTKSMLLSVERGQTASVGDLQIGRLGGADVELGKNALGQILASGTATLAGTLSLSSQGPTPSLTDTYEFMTYSSRSGAFDNVVVEEIQPGLSFSVHYDDTRALAIVGEWEAAGEELTGDFNVPDDLLVSNAWNWNGTLVKRGTGELVLDLDGGFSTGTSAALAIVDGTVRLRGTAQTLSLENLAFGDLGALSGDSSLAGVYGWHGKVAVPEPGSLVIVVVGLLRLGFWRCPVRVHG